jgi:hypothetical protein
MIMYLIENEGRLLIKLNLKELLGQLTKMIILFQYQQREMIDAYSLLLRVQDLNL